MPNFIAVLIGKFLKRKLDLQEGQQMDNTKRWYQSQTIWAGIITGLRGIYLVLQAVLPTFTSVHLPAIPPAVDAIAGTVLGGAVIHGRYTADSTIQ